MPSSQCFKTFTNHVFMPSEEKLWEREWNEKMDNEENDMTVMVGGKFSLAQFSHAVVSDSTTP